MSESKLPKKQVLDYSFARANGVLITTLDSEAVIIHRASTTFEAILEARRVQAKPAVLKEVSNGEFETLAAQVYASSDLSISAEDAIGKSSDLNALADGIPKI
jgi:general secretion pathway protein E